VRARHAATSLLALLIPASPAAGCAALAPGQYEQDRLDIVGEQAVIIWDETHHIEHFIRQADIDTNAKTVGFLVPTPNPPEVGEADPKIFDLAADIAHPSKAPYVVDHDLFAFAERSLWGPFNLTFFPTITNMELLAPKSNRAPLPAPGVAMTAGNPVLSQEDVGNFHATTLRADDEPALQGWLHDHGYVLNAAAAAWVESYATKKWNLTVFQFMRKEHARYGVTSSAIRMSFFSDRPFYPYSEPKKPDSDNDRYLPRSLSVAILTDKRMTGTLIEGIKWPARLRFAGPSSDGSESGKDHWLTLARLPSSSPVPGSLTYFRDISNPRPGKTDLVFTPSLNQTRFRFTEIDYADRHERIDWSNPSSTALGMAVIGLMTVVPIYCGWRVFPRRRRDPLANRSGTLSGFDRMFGLAAVAFGILESVIYLVSRPISFRLGESMFPGTDLPAPILDMPYLSLVFVGILLCGSFLVRGRRASSRFGLLMQYLTSVDSIVVGLLTLLIMALAITLINT
jgi:hypothetical protein